MNEFPKKRVETALKNWYKRKIESPFRKKTEGTVFDLQPEISSVETVAVFLEIKPLVGDLKNKSNLIKPGGYRSCTEFINDMLPKLEKRFNKYKKNAKQFSPKIERGVQANVNY